MNREESSCSFHIYMRFSKQVTLMWNSKLFKLYVIIHCWVLLSTNIDLRWWVRSLLSPERLWNLSTSCSIPRSRIFRSVPIQRIVDLSKCAIRKEVSPFLSWILFWIDSTAVFQSIQWFRRSYGWFVSRPRHWCATTAFSLFVTPLKSTPNRSKPSSMATL